MPTYDYRCSANGKTVEVKHSINEKLVTWGQVCQQAGIEVGNTPSDAPVERLITGGMFLSSGSSKTIEAPSCSSGACCPTGMCGFN